VRIRAILSQSLLAVVRTLPPGTHDAIMASLGDVPSAVDASLAISWIDVAVHMRLSDAVRDVVGPDKNVQLWRLAMARSFAHPILASFTKLATGLFGASPLSVLRHVSHIYAHLTQNLGTAGYDVGSPRSAYVWLRGFPAKNFRFICYVEGLAGCVESTFDICRTTGKVVVEHHDDAAGDLRFAVSWSPRADAHPSPG
jgi:hypothetical protein